MAVPLFVMLSLSLGASSRLDWRSFRQRVVDIVDEVVDAAIAVAYVVARTLPFRPIMKRCGMDEIA